jgi:hypothetical protein
MNYRKIYINHYGPIPKDAEGRAYHIHHIDGDRKNNDPKNLVALSLQEHYDVHYAQGDWAACRSLSSYMNISVEEKSRLARKSVMDQIAQGKNALCKKGKDHPRFDTHDGGRIPSTIVYTFCHKDGRVETLSRYDMMIKYPTLHSGDFSAMIRGKLKSHQGWKLR